MNHCKRAGCGHFLVMMAAVIAARFMGMFLTFCKRTSRSQSESFMAHRLDVFTEIATTDFVSDLHNSSESCSNAQWSYIYIYIFIQFYTLKNKRCFKCFSQRCRRRINFDSTKKHLVKGFFKEPSLSYLFIIWRTFFHHKEAFWKRRFFCGIMKHLYFKSVWKTKLSNGWKRSK